MTAITSAYASASAGSQDGLELLSEEDLMALKRQNLEEKEARDGIMSPSEYVKSVEDRVEWIPLKRLPSDNKPYPKGTLFAYRKYTYSELLSINNADLPLEYKYAIMLSGVRCVSELAVDPHLLTFDDFQFISTTRKLEAFGTTKFSLPYTCPSCGQDSSAVFTMADIEFNSMEAKKCPARVVFNQFLDQKFVFMPTTIGDILWLMKNDVYYKRDEEGMPLVTNSGRYVIDRIAVLARQCVNLDFEAAYEYLSQINNYDDIKILNELDNIFRHGIRPYVFKCQANLEALPTNYPEMSEEEKQQVLLRLNLTGKRCGETISLPLEGGEAIIVPFREPERAASAGIFFE